MDKERVLQRILLLISLILISAAIFALINQPAEYSGLEDTKRFKAEILGELASFEGRLEQQILGLNNQQEPSYAFSDAIQDDAQISSLSRQIQKILKQQEQYQHRLESIEKRLLSKLNRDDLGGLNKSAVEAAMMSQPNVHTSGEAIDRGESDRMSMSDEVAVHRIEQQLARYDQKLYEEEKDPQWASTLEQRLIRVINETQQLSGVHLQTSDCGTSICKLEVYVEENESIEEKVQMLMINRPWQGESFVSFEFDGNGRIFFAKDGMELP